MFINRETIIFPRFNVNRKIRPFMYTYRIFVLLIVSSNLAFSAYPSIQPINPFVPDMLEQAITDALNSGWDKYIKLNNIVCKLTTEQRLFVAELHFDKRYITVAENVSIKDINEKHYNQLIETLFRDDLSTYVHDLYKMLEQEGDPSEADKLSIHEILVTVGERAEKKNRLRALYPALLKFDQGSQLHSDIECNFGGDVENHLFELMEIDRDPPKHADLTLATNMAHKLKKEMDNWGDERDKIDEILIKTPLEQSKITIQKFNEVAGFSLKYAIETKMEEDKRPFYLQLFEFCANKHAFFAIRLDSCFNSGDHSCLARIFATHADTDLIDIQMEFHDLFKKTVHERVREISDHPDYTNLLFKILGDEKIIHERILPKAAV